MWPDGAYRHDPAKLVVKAVAAHPVRWDVEPAVRAYRRFSYDNATLGRTVAVPISATPAAVGGIGVVVASDDGYVRLCDRELRKDWWTRRLDSSIYASVLADPSRDRVIVAATSGLVVCLDLRGRLVWATRTGAPVFAMPTLSGPDRVVVATFHSRCLFLDASTGEVVVDAALPAPWYAAHDSPAAHRDVYASPLGMGDGGAILCAGEHVVRLAPDGSIVWAQDLGEVVKASPVGIRSAAEVAVCTVAGRCVFLDAAGGATRGEIRLGGKITASPALSGGVLAVGTTNGAVVGIATDGHRLLWRAPFGGPYDHTSFTTLESGDFVATSGSGNVVCLRRDDGAFLWETSQILGLPDHDPAMHVTPLVVPDGSMYVASYTGEAYAFAFRPVEEEDCR